MFFKNLVLVFLFVLFSSSSVFACDLDVKEKIIPLSKAEQTIAKRFFVDLQKAVAKADWVKVKAMIFYDSAKEESDWPGVNTIMHSFKDDRFMISEMKIWEIIGKQMEFWTPRKNFRGKFIHLSLEYRGKRYIEIEAKKAGKNIRYKKKMHFAILLLFRDQGGQWKIFIYARHDPGNTYLDFTP